MAALDSVRNLDGHQAVSEAEPALNRRRGAGLAALLAVATLAWWALRPAAAPPELPGPQLAASPAEPTLPVVSPPHSETEPASFYAGVPIRPAGSAEVNAQGMLPHPLTPEHQRIFLENALIGDLNGAMDVNDAPGLRSLLQQYRDEYPEDAHVLADGYALIADCLERPGPETRAAAQRYYDEQLDSGLRRYIRRHCLEESNP